MATANQTALFDSASALEKNLERYCKPLIKQEKDFSDGASDYVAALDCKTNINALRGVEHINSKQRELLDTAAKETTKLCEIYKQCQHLDENLIGELRPLVSALAAAAEAEAKAAAEAATKAAAEAATAKAAEATATAATAKAAEATATAATAAATAAAADKGSLAKVKTELAAVETELTKQQISLEKVKGVIGKAINGAIKASNDAKCTQDGKTALTDAAQKLQGAYDKIEQNEGSRKALNIQAKAACEVITKTLALVDDKFSTTSTEDKAGEFLLKLQCGKGQVKELKVGLDAAALNPDKIISTAAIGSTTNPQQMQLALEGLVSAMDSIQKVQAGIRRAEETSLEMLSKFTKKDKAKASSDRNQMSEIKKAILELCLREDKDERDQARFLQRLLAGE